MPRGNGGIIGPVNTSFSGVWSLTEAQLRRSANTWPNFYAALLSESATGSDAFTVGATADPYFEYTTLLLPGNGTNGAQNNTFLDGSTNNFTITRNGNTTQGTFSPFSQTGWGNYFDGTGDFLSSSGGTATAMGTGDFTWELFAYIPAATGYQGFIETRSNPGAGSTDGFGFLLNTGTLTPVVNTSSNVLTSSVNIVANAWNHIALTRSGTTLTVWVNGASGGSTTNSTNLTNQSFSIGGFSVSPNAYLTGYLSNIRITKGGVLYTTAFTPPTSPLTTTVSSGTVSLLTCQSNRFIDNSTNNFTITRNGDTSVVAFSPFNPTASWSAATYGGSGYFDGSGDYLSVPDNAAFTMGSGDFTIEAWVYKTSTGRQYVIGQSDSAGTNTSSSFTLQVNASNKVQGEIFSSSTQYLAASTADIVLNQWNHIAFVRDGSTLRIYINGAQDGTASVTGVSVNDSTNQLAIGRLGEFNGFYWAGYISSNRVLKGTCLYPNGTTFTPPTAPLTAITNTSLLLNFTNAGIYDATSKNDLETVGNAQISTTQSKWGGSSISFDGTGDWLLIPDQPPQRIGTGNFTVEMWVYRNSSGTYGLAGKGTGTTGWLVSLNSSNQVVFTYGSSTITSSGTVSATTWTHIAVVREGTSTNQTKIYISGTNDGTGTVSTDFNQTNSMYIGADRTGGSAANAYVQDVRITNYARYTANFTAPTAAFPTL